MYRRYSILSGPPSRQFYTQNYSFIKRSQVASCLICFREPLGCIFNNPRKNRIGFLPWECGGNSCEFSCMLETHCVYSTSIQTSKSLPCGLGIDNTSNILILTRYSLIYHLLLYFVYLNPSI